jgi:hypothetical protein
MLCYVLHLSILKYLLYLSIKSRWHILLLLLFMLSTAEHNVMWHMHTLWSLRNGSVQQNEVTLDLVHQRLFVSVQFEELGH